MSEAVTGRAQTEEQAGVRQHEGQMSRGRVVAAAGIAAALAGVEEV